ncbi:MAG TPA: Maf family protein [Steroidobacteraceae bacterium]|nr:Maf family protein [Steroidobacteraceae bacterium]
MLASASRYRRELLERLRLPFRMLTTGTEETPRTGEAARALAQRLALAKATNAATLAPDAWVIGSDQVAAAGDRILGKPGNREACIEQLTFASGRTLEFLTACCVLRGATGDSFQHIDTTRVRFRPLKSDEILRYVDAEQPFECAGGFKCEGLGVALFESIESRDPTALIGLPLIWLAATLRGCGFPVP